MWNISRASYYSDFIVIPFLLLAALYAMTITLPALAAVAVGAFIWTFVEYALHRWVFHRLYRREHWIHHIRPAAFIGVPAWQTGLAALAVLGGCWGGFGVDVGGGLFMGLGGGYLLYIWLHDTFHHGSVIQGSGGYVARREADHREHHDHGKEVNFGVVTRLWDVLLKTRP